MEGLYLEPKYHHNDTHRVIDTYYMVVWIAGKKFEKNRKTIEKSNFFEKKMAIFKLKFGPLRHPQILKFLRQVIVTRWVYQAMKENLPDRHQGLRYRAPTKTVFLTLKFIK